MALWCATVTTNADLCTLFALSLLRCLDVHHGLRFTSAFAVSAVLVAHAHATHVCCVASGPCVRLTGNAYDRDSHVRGNASRTLPALPPSTGLSVSRLTWP